MIAVPMSARSEAWIPASSHRTWSSVIFQPLMNSITITEPVQYSLNTSGAVILGSSEKFSRNRSMFWTSLTKSISVLSDLANSSTKPGRS